MNVHVFIDIGLEEQTEELRSYFEGLGAWNGEAKPSKSIEGDLSEIIGVSDLCLQESNDPSEIEGILNGIVSILITLEKNDELVLAFCSKLTMAPNNKVGLVCLRVLLLLFQSLGDKSPMRFNVYYNIIKVAGKVDQAQVLFNDMDKIKDQLTQSQLTTEQTQKIYRLLYEVLSSAKKGDIASQVMAELLRTYTTENASQAKEDATKCIVLALADPNCYLFDHLFALKPVLCLEGQPIYTLLTIFTAEKLSAYVSFYQKQKAFVESLGLKHEENFKKMQALTFLQMAETHSELSFDVLEKELQIQPNQIEGFVIDVLKTRLVRARLDQCARKVHIISALKRSFNRQQWEQLRQVLVEWKSNLSVITDNLTTVLSNPQQLVN